MKNTGIYLFSSLSFLAIVLMSPTSKAFIPSASYILERTVHNQSTSPIYYEQEVVLSSSVGSAHLKELWYIASPTQLKLIVQGAKDLKDKVQFVFSYSDDAKMTVKKGTKSSEAVSNEFLEPVFFLKAPMQLGSFLVDHKMLNPGYKSSKLYTKTGNNYNYNPDKQLRLSRTGGAVSYQMYTGNLDEGAAIWIEQDQFNIRKLKTEGKAVWTVDEYGNFSHGIRLPKARTIVWGGNQAHFQVYDSKTPNKGHSQLFANAQSYEKDEYLTFPTKNLIEEFYSRFR